MVLMELTALNVTLPSEEIGNLSEFQGSEAAGKCVPVAACEKVSTICVTKKQDEENVSV